MRFEDADQISYEMADIQAQIIKLRNKKHRTWQEQAELETLQAKLHHLRSIKR